MLYLRQRLFSATQATFLLLALASPIYAQSYSSSAFYPNPDTVMPGVMRQSWAQQPCRDPWINIAYSWALGRRPGGQGDLGECRTGQYNGGQWSNYNTLVHAIARYDQCMRSIAVSYAPQGFNWFVVNRANGLVGNDSASINAALIAQGGGNLIAQGGGNLRRYSLKGVTMYSCAN
jgi:hypothetical protein